MNTQIEFKTQIKNIREEALKIGYSKSTMNGYLNIWNNFIKWKNEDNFIYNKDDYIKFLFEYYDFNINSYTNKSKSRHQEYMRSKRILDDFDTYKKYMLKRVLSNSLYKVYPDNWNSTLDNYIEYLKNVRCNTDNSIKLKKDYVKRILSYFYQNKITNLNDITKEHVTLFINMAVNSGKVSLRRNFYVLREFLNYLFIENILKVDLSIYVPKIKEVKRKKLPTYLKQDQVESLLESIPRTRNTEIRDYAIILIAARLGLRISDILNIKVKDIDFKNHKFKVIQPKTQNINVLPLLNDVGWAIIDYVKNARPKCSNEYLFIKHSYPYKKMEQFTQYRKYFQKTDIELEESHHGGIHNLRHSFATNLLENGIPIDIIANSLGDSRETTSNTYLKLDKIKLKACVLEDPNEL